MRDKGNFTKKFYECPERGWAFLDSTEIDFSTFIAKQRSGLVSLTVAPKQVQK